MNIWYPRTSNGWSSVEFENLTEILLACCQENIFVIVMIPSAEIMMLCFKFIVDGSHRDIKKVTQEEHRNKLMKQSSVKMSELEIEYVLDETEIEQQPHVYFPKFIFEALFKTPYDESQEPKKLEDRQFDITPGYSDLHLTAYKCNELFNPNMLCIQFMGSDVFTSSFCFYKK